MFRRNFLACFIRDRIGVSLRDEIGIETICWEMDYPHSDSSWPDAAEQLAAQLEGCNQSEVDAICWQNAATRFHYDGVERLGRDACTVGALRERVSERDLSAPKVAAGRAPKPGTKPITFGDMKVRMGAVMTGGK